MVNYTHLHVTVFRDLSLSLSLRQCKHAHLARNLVTFGARAFLHFEAGSIAKSCANHIVMTCPLGSACCRSSRGCTACPAGFRSFLFCLHQRTGDEVQLATVTTEKCHVYQEHNRFFEASISGQTLFAREAMAVFILIGNMWQLFI